MRIRPGVAAWLLVLVLCFPDPAPAQNASPEALRAANELFSILSKDVVGQMADQMIAQIWPPIEQRLRSGANVDDATLMELRGELARIMRTYLMEVLKEGPVIYARHFTVQELQDLIGFYHTPTGQKALHELPQVTAELFGYIRPRLETVQKETADAFARILRERGYGK
jgi:hypothetical protein